MIGQHLARKLLVYVLYSAAVTALPILGTTPVVQVVRPLLTNEVSDQGRRTSCPCEVVQEMATTSQHQVAATPWWRRGPVRRTVRGIALFVVRPWRR